MVVQTHHYRKPSYLFWSIAFAGAGVALLARGSMLPELSAQVGLLATAALSLLAGLFLALRYLNECIYFAPARLIYVNCLGRRRAEIPFEELNAVRPIPGTFGAMHLIEGRGCSVRFDSSITDSDALKGELDWQMSKHQPGSPARGLIGSARAAYPPRAA